MRVIGFNDICKLNISTLQCYAWVEQMLQRKKDMILPPKVHMPIEENSFCNVMPCIIQQEDRHIGGVKIVTRYPQREPSLDSKILLFDGDTGAFIALLDGNWITAMRTGAVAAHSIDLFAVDNYSEIAMIGLGNTARSSLLILLEKHPEQQFHVRLLRYKNQAELFEKRFDAYSNIQFTIFDDVKDMIKGAQVVLSCATYFENDICPDDYFDEGVLVVPVHTRGFTNCDLFFDKVYADDTGHVDHFRYFSRFRHYAEVNEVMCGEKAGREHDKERILVYNIGLAIHDIYFAYNICNILKNNTETFIPLNYIDLLEPAVKFWV